MIIYQGECTAWTLNVEQQNIETHIAARDRYAAEAAALRDWCALDDVPPDADFMWRRRCDRHDQDADVYQWMHNGL